MRQVRAIQTRALTYGRTLCPYVSALLIVLCVSARVVRACDPVEIPIANAGFESDSVSPGCFEVMSLADWVEFDPNGLLDGGNNSVGGLNLPPGSVFFPGGAPEGEHAALIFLLTTTGQGPVGLRQVLSATLQPDTTYTLSAQVGDIASGVGPPPCDVFGEFNLEGFPGYQVQLLAGGVVIAQDDNSLAGVLDEGLFAESTCQVTIGNSHPQLSQSLEIRLINLNLEDTPANPGIEVDFDDVRLTAQLNAPALLADLDCDGDVDLVDYAIFVSCFAGPDVPPAATCPADVDANLDGDADVDLADALIFERALTGN